MKPKNLTVSNICKAIAKENNMKVEDISSQVSYLLISVHNTNEHNKLNAIYESYKLVKPSSTGNSKTNGKLFTMDDRINFVNGFVDINDVLDKSDTIPDRDTIIEELSFSAIEVLREDYKEQAKRNGVKKIDNIRSKEFRNLCAKYINGMRKGYEYVFKIKGDEIHGRKKSKGIV